MASYFLGVGKIIDSSMVRVRVRFRVTLTLVSQSQTKLQEIEWSGTTLFRAVYPWGNWAGLFLFL